MSEQVVTLRIVGENGHVVGTIRATKAELGGLGKSADDAGKVMAGTANRLNSIGRSSSSARREVGLLSGTVREFKGILAGFVGFKAIENAVGGMIRAGLEAQRMNNSLAAATGSNSSAAREMGYLRAEAQRLGVYLPTLVQGYVGLTAATRGTRLEGEATRKIFSAIVEAGRAMNLSNADIEGTLQAVQQMAGKGVVSMEELRQQLGDRLPGAMQASARAMGMTVPEFIKLASSGQLLSEEFLPKLAAELHRTAQAAAEANANSPSGQFEKLKTVLFEVGVEASKGTLKSLGDAAGALARGLQSVVGNGSIPAIISGLGNIATMAAVWYVGGKLQAGIMMVTAAWNSQRLALVTVNGLYVASNALIGVGTANMTRFTVAQTAAIFAARGLGAALAFIQANPILLAVTAVVGLVMWLRKSEEAARDAAQTLNQGFTSAKQSLEDFARAPSIQGAAVALEGVREEIDKINILLVKARNEQDRVFSNPHAAAAQSARQYSEISQRVAELEGKQRVLAEAVTTAQVALMQEFQALVGIQNPTQAARDRFAELAKQKMENTITDRELGVELGKVAASLGLTASAARLAELGFGGARTEAAKFGEVLAGLDSDINSAIVNLARLQQGQWAAYQIKVGQQINAKGGVSAMTPKERAEVNADLAVMKSLMAQTEATEKAQSAARKSATQAIRDQKAAVRQGIRDDNAAEQATRKLNDLIREQAALYAGPVAKESRAHQDALAKISEIEKDLIKHHRLNADAQRNLKDARAEAEEAHRRGAVIAEREAAEIERQKDLVNYTAKSYEDEARMVGLSEREHAIAEATLKAETAARDQFNKKLRTSIDLTDEERAGLSMRVGAAADQKRIVQDAQRFAADFANIWGGAVDGIASAFGDWVSRGFRGAKDMLGSLKQTFQRWLADLITMFARSKIAQWLTGVAGNYAAKGGGDFFSQLAGMAANYFGGGKNGGPAYGGSYGGNGIAGLFATMFGANRGSGGFGGAGGGGWGSYVAAAQSVFGGGARVPGAVMAAGGAMTLPQGYGVVPMSGAAATGSGGWMSTLMQYAKSPWVGAAAGAIYGWRQGGDTPGKAAGAAAYGAVGYAGMAAGAAGMGALAAGGGLAAAGTAALAAVPVVGWIALAAIVVDKLSGGKLFGTKFKAESGAQQLDFSGTGVSGFNSQTQVRNKSFFRGREWKTTTTGLDAETQKGIDDFFKTLSQSVTQAAQGLGVQAPEMVAASFRREFDAKGNLTSEFGTIAGRVYKEAQEAFTKRLVGENLLAVAKVVGNGAEIETIANQYRDTGEAINEFATLMLAVQSDVKNGLQLWADTGAGSLTKVTDAMERMAIGAESLAETYKRVTEKANAYGQLIGGVQKDITMHGLNEYSRAQVEVELGYRDQVKQANELAKALGLSGARAEDLARIEQLRAIRMADLKTQYEAKKNNFLADLSLSDLSPLRDAQKLDEAKRQFYLARDAGDQQRSEQMLQTALGLGRNLYASGRDYNSLYEELTGAYRGMSPAEMSGLDNAELKRIADGILSLPVEIARAIFSQASGMSPVTSAPVLPPINLPITTPTTPSVPVAAGGSNSDALLTETNSLLRQLLRNAELGVEDNRLRMLQEQLN